MSGTKLRAFQASALLVCILLGLSACATTGGRSYTRNEARQVQTVQRGTIVSIDSVRIEEDASGVGTVLGGVAGGVLGSTIGRGSGRVLATVGGAAAGAALGTVGEKALRSENALEIMVELENDGGTLSVVQADDGTNFSVGDQVRILRSGGRARVAF